MPKKKEVDLTELSEVKQKLAQGGLESHEEYDPA